jgi:hypothetical protein
MAYAGSDPSGMVCAVIAGEVWRGRGPAFAAHIRLPSATAAAIALP